jgi:hypothetical protein
MLQEDVLITPSFQNSATCDVVEAADWISYDSDWIIYDSRHQTTGAQGTMSDHHMSTTESHCVCSADPNVDRLYKGDESADSADLSKVVNAVLTRSREFLSPMAAIGACLAAITLVAALTRRHGRLICRHGVGADGHPRSFLKSDVGLLVAKGGRIGCGATAWLVGFLALALAFLPAANAQDCVAGTYLVDCYPTVGVHIHLTEYADSHTWSIDGGEVTTYTRAQSDDAHFHPVVLPVGNHAFAYTDSYGEQFGGGAYWEIRDACGGVIGGGPADGLFTGYGGTFAFAGSAQCCTCEASVGCVAADLPTSTSAECLDCAAGRFSDTTRAAECTTVCAAGQYSPSSVGVNRATVAALDCVACAPGKSDMDKSPVTPCEDCAVGRYSDAIGATVECTSVCATGFHSGVGSTSASDCVACPAGRFGDLDGATPSCVSCATGHAQGRPGQTACETCGVEHYAPEGSTRCAERVDLTPDLITTIHGGDSPLSQLQSRVDNPFATAAGDTTAVEVADIDGDGDLDVLIATSAGDNVYLENDGVLRAVPDSPFATATCYCGAVEAADLDGDGDLDGLMAN